MSQSSLSSVVSGLVRAQMGSSVSGTVTDEDLDRHVAELILKEAKRKAERYESQGIRAFLPEPGSNAPRANKRFLSSIIRNTDEHNKTILRAQALAAQEIKQQREEQERRERRARAEEAAEAERLRRWGRDTSRDRRRSGDSKRRERSWEKRDRNNEGEDDDYDRERRRKSRRHRYEEDDRSRRHRSSRRKRQHSPSYSTERSEDEGRRHRLHRKIYADQDEYRSSRHRREKKRARSRSHSVSEDSQYDYADRDEDRSARRRREKKRARSRSRSVSQDSRSDRRRDRERSHRSRNTADDVKDAQSLDPSRKLSRSRSRSVVSDDDETLSSRGGRSRDNVPSSSKHSPRYDSNTSKEAEFCSKHKGKGKTREDFIDPPKKSSHNSRPRSPSSTPPPEPPPPIASKMDKYFTSTYDPRLDVAPLKVPEIPATGLIDDATFEGWDAMLKVIELRRQDKAEKKWLEKHGIKDSGSSKEKKGDEGPSVMDIEYKKRGAVREWDLCKETPT